MKMKKKERKKEKNKYFGLMSFLLTPLKMCRFSVHASHATVVFLIDKKSIFRDYFIFLSLSIKTIIKHL